MTIFISIAAYRDPELVPTVEDCLARARRPDALRFGICWQHGTEEPALPFARDRRFTVLDVPWRESRGACWARARIMGVYGGEDHYLQLDSHHRFVDGWDERLLDHLARAGGDRAVLTTYATPFVPGDADSFGDEPMEMRFDRFTPDGLVLFRPAAIDGWRTRTAPVRARFLSAHFLFAPGAFVREVPYDPDLYFTGEEISLAVRAFTRGWDLFHPTEVIVWHEYTRSYRPHKHWSDHEADQGVEVAWHVRDAASRARVRRLLDGAIEGPFGCGDTRTLADYEAYAGLDLRRRRAHPYTLAGGEPPSPPAGPGWADALERYDLTVAVDRALLVPEASEAAFWYVGFHDETERELYREDAARDEVGALLAGEGAQLPIRRAFTSNREPASWTVWPSHPQLGWLDRIRGPVVVRRPRAATFVTALVDVGRGALDGPHARAFEAHYLPLFTRLLRLDAPMVVYVEPEREALVWEHRRREDTRVVPLTRTDLERSPLYRPVQAIRARPDWAAQAGWLAESPQARLPHYNPLVLSKPGWLRAAAEEDPFGTDTFFWVDAGLGHTVRDTLLLDPALPGRLRGAAADAPVLLAFPYRGAAEVHGFPSDELARLAGGPVERVVRGGLFGGRARHLHALVALYDAALERTLAAGLMGTEESVLSLVVRRYPELARPFLLGDDGLVAPFLQALLEGRAELLRAPPEPPPSASAAPAAPGIVAEAREAATTGRTRFMGLSLQKNDNTPFALQALWRELERRGTPPARIVEIGAGDGGLSVLLQLYGLGVGADFVTYDVDARSRDTPAFVRLGIELRVADVSEPLVVDEIARALGGDGVSVLVVDGGDRLRDVTTFVPHLGEGDVLLVHDYAPSEAEFERALRGRLWSWCEVTDAALRDVSEQHGLEEILPEVMHPAAWTCRVKHGPPRRRAPALNVAGRSVALYALGFNRPAQLALWLRSVERVDPAMLDGTERFLLDNSTDPSTAPAYDALAARYGFRTLRRGNLGITGGRIHCARHFEEETTHDAMLYFEDDMLLAEEDGRCRNGLPTRVPDLFERALEVLRLEPDLDFLKLSFTELFGDHRVQWAARSLDEEARHRLFPDGTATRVTAVRSHGGLPYLLGEVHYSNWPMLITRRGSRTLFAPWAEAPRHEQGLMLRALDLGRAGALRGGVLLASPIRHARLHHYPAEDRKEG